MSAILFTNDVANCLTMILTPFAHSMAYSQANYILGLKPLIYIVVKYIAHEYAVSDLYW